MDQLYSKLLKQRKNLQSQHTQLPQHKIIEKSEKLDNQFFRSRRSSQLDHFNSHRQPFQSQEQHRIKSNRVKELQLHVHFETEPLYRQPFSHNPLFKPPLFKKFNYTDLNCLESPTLKRIQHSQLNHDLLLFKPIIGQQQQKFLPCKELEQAFHPYNFQYQESPLHHLYPSLHQHYSFSPRYQYESQLLIERQYSQLYNLYPVLNKQYPEIHMQEAKKLERTQLQQLYPNLHQKEREIQLAEQ